MKGAVQPALGAEKWRISMANEKNDELGDLTMRSKQSQIIGLIVALLLPFVVVGLGVAATSSSLSDWYLTLKKPAWNPPPWLFGPVWTVLYLMMGLSSWLVWREGPRQPAGVKQALVWYAVQLGLNALWSIFFFGMRQIGLALVDIIALWITLLITIIKFWQIRSVAGWLMTPYLLWVTFATALNSAIWWLNRE
jgi:tryptophan-rich sensory protein